MANKVVSDDGIEYEVVLKKITSSAPQTPPITPNLPSVLNGDFSLKKLAVDNYGESKRVSWEMHGGSGNYSYRLGDTTYPSPFMIAPNNVQWDITVIDNQTRKEVTFKVDTAKTGTINFNITDNPIVINTTEVPVVTTPPVVDNSYSVVKETNFAQIGVVYESEIRARLLCPSRENSNNPQYLKIEDESGNIIYNYNRLLGFKAESEYWGNHGRESQFALKEGNYKITVINTGVLPIITGITDKDQYAFYNIRGHLKLTNFWKRLLTNENVSFIQYIKDNENKKSVMRNWNDTANAFRLTCPFYENGEITTDEVVVEGRPNGLEVMEHSSEFFRFFKKSNPSKNTVIQLITGGIHDIPKFKVIEKNGLEINPKYTMLTCWNISWYKIFNNLSSGYIDSDDFKPS